MYKIILSCFLILSFCSYSAAQELKKESIMEKLTIKESAEGLNIEDFNHEIIKVVEIKDFVEANSVKVYKECVVKKSGEPTYFRKVVLKKYGNDKDEKKYIFYDVAPVNPHSEIGFLESDGFFDLYIIRDHKNQEVYKSKLPTNNEFNVKLNTLVINKVDNVIESIIASIKSDQAKVLNMDGLLKVEFPRGIFEAGKDKYGYLIRLGDLGGLSIVSLRQGGLLYDKFVNLIQWIKGYSKENQEIKKLFEEL